MTQDKARKTAIRARMAAKGEPYAEAARRVDGSNDPANVSGVWDGVAEPYCAVRIAASVLFSDEAGRILLVRPADKAGWVLPGRHLRRHEEPSQASVELVPEQLGISPTIGDMLVVDWSPDPDDFDGFPDANKLMFVFDGGQLTAEHRARIRLDPAETAEYAFRTAEDIKQLLYPRLARRVAAAVAARDGGSDRYLVIGIGGR